MDASIYARVKKLQIISKKMSRSGLMGDYASAFKGLGLEFDQLRPYVPGDDVRSIDWNASARNDETMVKTFIQERDRSIVVAVDASESMFYGSGSMLKYDFACTVMSALGSIAVHSHDKFGTALFSSDVDLWMPPARGVGHFSRILSQASEVSGSGKRTSLDALFAFLLSLRNKRGVVVFVLSDWLDDQIFTSKNISAVARYYDLIAVSIVDPRERMFLNRGALFMEDPESGKQYPVATSQLTPRRVSELFFKRKDDFLRKKGVSHLTLEVGDGWVASLARFFKERTRRQIS